MRCFWRVTSALTMLLVLSACNFFAPPQNQPLDLLESDTSSTEIAALRATATADIDRLMITLESAQTAVRAVDVQSTRIASTLIARGTPFIDISQITPVAPTAFSFAGDPNNTSLDPGVQVLVTPGGGAQGNQAISTPIAPVDTGVVGTPTPLPGVGGGIENTNPDAGTSGGSVLSNITLSRAVGADDCASQSDTVFSTNDTDIYVVATAQGLTMNSVVSARFTRDGTEVAVYDWTAPFDINGACIWFYMPSSAVAYVAGNWSVALTVNGASAGAANFTIDDMTTQ